MWCLDHLSEAPDADILVKPGESVFKIKVVTCIGKSDYFKDVSVCPDIQTSKNYLNAYNVTLQLIKSRKFDKTKYSYQFLPLASEKEGFPKILPSGHPQLDVPGLRQVIWWFYSLPVFKEEAL